MGGPLPTTPPLELSCICFPTCVMAELPPWVGFNHLHLKKKKEHRDWVCVSLLVLEKVPGDVAFSVPPPTTLPRPRPRPDQSAQPVSQGCSSKLAWSRWAPPPPACRAQEVHHFHPVAARRLLCCRTPPSPPPPHAASEGSVQQTSRK